MASSRCRMEAATALGAQGPRAFLREFDRLVVGSACGLRSNWPDTGLDSPFDIAPDGKRVAALIDAAESKPATYLKVLNVGEEMRRRELTDANASEPSR